MLNTNSPSILRDILQIVSDIKNDLFIFKKDPSIKEIGVADVKAEVLLLKKANEVTIKINVVYKLSDGLFKTLSFLSISHFADNLSDLHVSEASTHDISQALAHWFSFCSEELSGRVTEDQWAVLNAPHRRYVFLAMQTWTLQHSNVPTVSINQEPGCERPLEVEMMLERGNPAEGASIGVSGQAANAAEELGLYEKLFQAGRHIDRSYSALDLRDTDGDIISKARSDPYGPNSKETVCIYRPTWIRIMTETASELGVQIRPLTTYTAIDNRSDGVTVTTTHGEVLEADIVIGADGLHSAVRELLFPDHPPLTYSGQLSIRWMAPGAQVDPESWYTSSQGRLSFYWLPENLVYIASVLHAPEAKHLSADEVRLRFTKLLDSFSAPALKELRSRFDQHVELIARNYYWILLPDPWFRHRGILIGDAAHATTSHMGQGGGMALEDSVVLAQCIRDSSSLEEAFGGFMKRRFERVSTVVNASVQLSRLEQQEDWSPQERMVYRGKAMAAISAPY
ncbi:hypothetical protein M409DRAFT_16499 [Zasmidium cellare ATCC 36951]|uniref:FAD-binding domain-containing protein n=1 Tax=Zasmidium cellare ATCC 36951 TaxID=1080233 RepID=A0A6A6D9B1_ZASCE|nr:uncharacterized protein M409DRAFT_16499 [Zasmidium cellare ATCC 36951]KAF2174236.1 hypothetical protein M409DRAFT_16499 [Zasmidium cellare ATCC 36951]